MSIEDKLHPKHFMRRAVPNRVVTFADLHRFLEPGELIERHGPPALPSGLQNGTCRSFRAGRSSAAGIGLAAGVGLGHLNSPFATLHKGTLNDDRTMDWEGRSFQMPPYWGMQANYWLTPGPGWGVGLDYTHTKAHAALNFATDPIYRHLEFTDGNNLLLFNVMYRFAPIADGGLLPYFGIGAVPDELRTN